MTYVDEGIRLLKEGRALAAVAVFRQAFAAGEDGAADLLVRSWFESGSWAAAAAWLEPRVVAGYTEFASALGTALAAVGDVDGAENAFRLAIDTGDLAAANDLAILLRDEGRPVEARQVLEGAVAAGDPMAPANLVELHLDAGRMLDAVACAERYADETKPDTLVALADVRALQRRDDDAERLYRQAAQLGASRANTAYGRFLVERGDSAGAEAVFRAAVEAGEPGWATTMGRFLVETGRPDAAREYLQAGVDAGDAEAGALLDQLDGVDPTDD